MSGPRYRDADGDVWEEQPSGMLVGTGEAEIAGTGTREQIENRYGPLTAIPETRKSVRNETPNPALDAALAYAQSVADGIPAEEALSNATAYFDGDTPEAESYEWTGEPQHTESRRTPPVSVFNFAQPESAAVRMPRVITESGTVLHHGDGEGAGVLVIPDSLIPVVESRRKAVLLGGPFDMSEFHPTYFPNRVEVAGCIYTQITDPDTGEGLGAYAFEPTGKR